MFVILSFYLNSVQKIQIILELGIPVIFLLSSVQTHISRFCLVRLGLGPSKLHFLDFFAKWLLISSVDKRHQRETERLEEEGTFFLFSVLVSSVSAEVITFRLLKDSWREFQHSLSESGRSSQVTPSLRSEHELRL